MDLKNKLETTTKNHQASIQNLEAKFDRLADKQSGRPFGSLPSNTQPNSKGSSSKPYQPPQARNEHVNAVFTRSAKNMLVKVDKFTFSVDFVILEMEEDSKVPLILGRPFLYTVDEVIRAKQKQLNLGVGTERDFTGPLGPPSGLKGLLHMLNAIVIPTKPYRLCTCGGAWILNKLRGSITNWTSWMLYFWLIMLHVMLDIVRGSRLGAWL
ncbi:reverse transcriptase domain-containing protein [Tanacetum coccineum]